MNNKVDKLFKDKLEGHALQPSAQAWEKVEAHLGKKNKMVLWLRVAAALMLFGLLTFVGLNWNTTEPKKELAKKETEVKSQEPVTQPEEIKQEIKKEIPEKNQKKKPAEPVVVPITTLVVEEPQIAIVVEKEEPQKPEIKKEKGITLTYSLPTIKKEEPVAIAQEEPKKNGLERVLEIAREVKNGDSALGELREAKDNILALDFRKDKKQKH